MDSIHLSGSFLCSKLKSLKTLSKKTYSYNITQIIRNYSEHNVIIKNIELAIISYTSLKM